MPQSFKSRLGRWFDPGELSRAYRACLRSPLGVALVIPDLHEFCHVGEALPRTYEPYSAGILAGRLDVWLHIKELLHLTEDELFDLYRGRAVSLVPQPER